MLVLSRKTGEKVKIIVPPNPHSETVIMVVVVETSDYRSRIGFDAAEEVKIWREELCD
jgi:carbon storage regulator CsrA